MMREILKFICLVLVIINTSCKREYAHFQKTSSESFTHKPKIKLHVLENKQEEIVKTDIEEIELLHPPTEPSVVATTTEIFVSPATNAKDNTTVIPKRPSKNKRELSAKEKVKAFFKQAQNSIAPQKHLKKRRGFWDGFNERLKIGLILLAVAIIFALLHINVLAIIFGLVAAFMIIRGLKRLF